MKESKREKEIKEEYLGEIFGKLREKIFRKEVIKCGGSLEVK